LDKVNACFISYRHTGDIEADKFVRTFVIQLKKQVALCMPGVPIFFDEQGLKVGDQYKGELAYQLCRSACMVLIFSPLYFDIHHHYCALEYKGMLEIERKRLELGLGDLQHKGLIFPVVFRGLDCLPQEIKDDRHYENFDFVVSESDFRRRHCQERLKALSEEIWKCYRILHNARVFSSENCGGFCFPEKASIESWLNRVAQLDGQGYRMPGR
jgi:hypothetical protein